MACSSLSLRAGLTCIVTMGAPVSGCARDAIPGPPQDLAVIDAGCTAPLMEFCGKGMCPRYDDAVAQARTEATLDGCWYVVIGTCGIDRVVAIGGAFGGDTMYFDAGGQLVAALRSTDTNAYCDNTSFSIEFGALPRCTLQPIETLCLFGHTDLGTRD